MSVLLQEDAARLCECGCKTALTGKQRRWATDACRMRAKRAERDARPHRKRTRRLEVRHSHARVIEMVLEAARKAAEAASVRWEISGAEVDLIALRCIDNRLTDRQKEALNRRRRAA